MLIGQIIAKDREIILNANKETVTLMVANTGDRPVQVGSHYHFFEVNRCLAFDRGAAYGFHLDIPSGTSVRFEPGEEREVKLTAFGGTRRIFGFNDLTCAQANAATAPAALEAAALKGFTTK
ncbi:urease subunit beta [Eubacterium aggregans]|uniref:Urease subunit beta n=1 Tax=Eubacterium aggregans TaxID=81409 RepID=A0A1H3WWY6_9FIRM|nr:urease subunit beta [Eubacterium aggregans]SDZ90884.1 urease subunit beta [Eubacterium aggregans]